MRSAIAVAAFAANVLAVPYMKRDEVVVTDVDVVYATDVVTVFATEGAQTAAAFVAPTMTGHWGHSWNGFPSEADSSTSTSTSSTSTSTSTSVYVAPVTTSTTTPPPPPPSTTSTSTTPVYTPPPAPTTPSTTSTYVAPYTPLTTVAPVVSSWAAAIPSGADVATGTFTVGNPITWTSSAAYTGYSDVVVMHHNFHRFNHSSQNVEWNETLAKSAQDLANTCSYGHNTDMDGGGYGQNIAAGVDMNNITTVITDLFYNGEVPWFNGLYGQANPDMTHFENWGHFSQIVWNATTSVGCATSNCTAGGLGNVGSDTPAFFTVCNYFPSGNWGGEYGDNIGDSKNIPTIEWNAS